MRNRLLPVLSTVENGSISTTEAFLSGDPAGHDEQMPDELSIVLGQVVKTRDRPSWTDQYVRGRLGIDVAERETGLVLEHDRGRDLSVTDPLEKCLLTHCIRGRAGGFVLPKTVWTI